jgi:glutamyl-tRNA reductase
VRGLPPETRAEVEYLTQALVAKLLHRPISQLKTLGAGASASSALLRRLFKLE